MPVTAANTHSRKDLEIILQALPEPNFVKIYAYSDSKTSIKVQALIYTANRNMVH